MANWNQEEREHRAAERLYWVATGIFTTIAAGAAVAAAVFAHNAWIAAKSQAQTASSEYSLVDNTVKATQLAANAALLEAVSNRAFLFVSYPGAAPSEQYPPIFPLDIGGYNGRSVTYKITNSGETPARVTNVDERLLSIPERNPDPNPLKPSSRVVSGELWSRQPLASEYTSLIGEDIASHSFILPAKSSVTYADTFHFPQSSLDVNRRDRLDFYCKVTYQDIYGVSRSSCVYLKLTGASYEEISSPQGCNML